MRIKLFTFRYSASLGGFDDRPLTQFVRDKEIVAFGEHFFCVNELPHITSVLTWQDAVVREEDLEVARELRTHPPVDPSRVPIPAPQEKQRRRSRRNSAPDPTEGMDERERALFNTLREWHSARAKQEGVPPYLIFTNKHFAQTVTTRPDSPTALGNLHGVGVAKVTKYGKAVLEILSDAPSAEQLREPDAEEAHAQAPA